MRRRDFCRLSAAGASAWLTHPFEAFCLSSNASPWPSSLYANNRAPLLNSKFVRLPLGSIAPAGWLNDQLHLQATGLTVRLGELWDVLRESAWKGDVEKHVTPECCTARFAPRWLEGVTLLAGVLHDERIRRITDPYMEFILRVTDLPSVTPSLIAWFHLGRFLPDYYELTHDERALRCAGAILRYADQVHTSKDMAVVDPSRLGMLLNIGWWHYNQTGDTETLAIIDRCARDCVKDWMTWFVNFPRDPQYFAHFPDRTAEKPGERPERWSRHGVNVTQAIQYPLLWFLRSHDPTNIDSVLQGISNLDQGYGQVGGRWNADEWLASTDPVQGTELCDVEELLFCLENGLAVTGITAFADRVEQLIFNAFPGTCTADMWAHQYDQQANQVLVSVADRPWHLNDRTSNIYGFAPNFPCCLSNMHSPWPRFVRSMWLATADSGVAAVLYGPCRVEARVGENHSVIIEEQTDYPFSDQVRFVIRTAEPVSFPIHFRIPAWSDSVDCFVSGKRFEGPIRAGDFLRLHRTWRDGDVVDLKFHFKVHTENRRNNAAAIAWGPLYFALRIGESFRRIDLPGIPTPATCVNWEVTPTTPWNVALAIDRDHPVCEMARNPIGSMPFAQKGEPVRPPEADDFSPWQGDAPLILRVNAKEVADWKMNGANAASVPVSPVRSKPAGKVVELIPYGCSRLRISEFPVAAPEDVETPGD
ncbi:MAG TPA: hypothetical protein VHZ25_02830 [Acidobacteriaceae bacterium]|jgi:hypothetical protein|nr:hypothetical protein [Acidobacteriaceae bacterium]